jgi:PAS domain S-box-containing protein
MAGTLVSKEKRMHRNLRKTGIDVMGDVPWSTHSCQFYRSGADLLETIVPFMKAGLENNELCVWITSAPVKKDAAEAAMSAAMPDFAKYVREGRIEMVPHTDWYLKDGVFDPAKALKGWAAKYNSAIGRGFEGLRAATSTSWLRKKDWKAFSDHEKDCNLSLDKQKILAVCAYPLKGRAAAEVIDVVSNHQISLIKHEGAWTLVESSEKRKAEEKILESEARYRGLYESIRDGIMRTDIDGRIVDCNRAYLDMLGFSMDEIRNMTFLDLTPAKWHETNRLIIRDQLMTRGYSDEYEKEYIRKDGSVIPVSNRTWLIEDNDGRPAGMWSIVRDITAHKRAEEEITKLHLELNGQIRKLEEVNSELEAFNFSLAHDLSTPLRIIDGFSKMLEKYHQDSLGGEGREFIKTIRGSSRKMGMFINDLLKLARLGRSEIRKSEIDMSGLAAALSSEIGSMAQRKVEFRITPLPPALGEETLIRQALFNLLSNAVKFAGPRERPVVEVGCEAAATGECVYFVRDNGVGFDMRHADKLFGVFKRLHTESEFEGTGAGLAIVKRVIQRHGGRVWADARVGEGATFYFTLPK